MSNEEIQSQFAFWGPSGSGKTWLMRSFGKALSLYNQPNSRRYDTDFEYILSDSSSHPIPQTPPTIQATSDLYDTVWHFKRVGRKQTKQHIVSAQAHDIHVADAKGEDTIQGHARPVNVGIENAQCLLLILDPLIGQMGGISGISTPDEYVNEVNNLLNRLQPRSDRFIAACVSKIDQLGVRRRPPYEVIDMFFGAAMVTRLTAYAQATGAKLNAFTVSAMGYLNNAEEEANYDIGSDYIMNKDQWNPYNVEQPFFWLFESVERLRVQRAGSETARILFGGDRLKYYLGYPKPR